MTKYNWDERHIITFPEKELALETKDLHVYYGQKEAIKGIDNLLEIFFFQIKRQDQRNASGRANSL